MNPENEFRSAILDKENKEKWSMYFSILDNSQIREDIGSNRWPEVLEYLIQANKQTDMSLWIMDRMKSEWSSEMPTSDLFLSDSSMKYSLFQLKIILEQVIQNEIFTLKLGRSSHIAYDIIFVRGSSISEFIQLYERSFYISSSTKFNPKFAQPNSWYQISISGWMLVDTIDESNLIFIVMKQIVSTFLHDYYFKKSSEPS